MKLTAAELASDSILAKLNQWEALLAECRTAEEAKHVADLSEAAQVYLRRVGASKEVVNQAAEYKLRAERRLGEILARSKKAKGTAGLGRPKKGDTRRVLPKITPTLADAGIPLKLSARAQKLAALPATTFEEKIAEAKIASRDLSFTTFANKAGRSAIYAAKVAQPLPEGQFRVIYADPPYKYGGGCLDAYGHAERHYRTMSMEELCALPVHDLAAPDAVLFLWATSPMLEKAFVIIRAWGFKYKASFVWDKVKHNFGHYNSVRHEHLLICTRGSCTPDNSELLDSVQSIERSGKHSEKPEEFRKIIETLYPSGPKIELFARKSPPGWSVWGDECLE
jgi:N6-adenosine-specific RNA methylase IME4